MTDTKIGVIGAGAWGTALAQVIAGGGHDVLLWAREPDLVGTINETHENTTYLPGVSLHKKIVATNSLSEAVTADIILLVTPAQYIRALLQSLKGNLSDGKPLVICSKGIETETGLLLSDVMKEEVPNAICAVMTGPTFASEIAAGLPSAMTLAVKNKDTAKELRALMHTQHLRMYVTDDVIGTQIGGAIKNVIAIACGILHGRKMGESARAALVTRGLAEMARLAHVMGGQKETLMGMCGMGDLVLTCSSMQSRNFSLGVALGQGEKLKDILEKRNSVTEGIHTADAVLQLARKNAVDMPISEAVHDCLHGKKIDDIISQMLERPLN